MSSQGCSGCAPRPVKSFWGGGQAVRCKPQQISGCCFGMSFVDGLTSSVTVPLTLTLTFHGTVTGLPGCQRSWHQSGVTSDGRLTGGNAGLVVPAAACASNSPGCMCWLPKTQVYVLFLDGGRLAPYENPAADPLAHRGGRSRATPNPPNLSQFSPGRDFQGSPKFGTLSMTDLRLQHPEPPSTNRDQPGLPAYLLGSVKDLNCLIIPLRNSHPELRPALGLPPHDIPVRNIYPVRFLASLHAQLVSL